MYEPKPIPPPLVHTQAPGAIPLLGHALAYKSDPPGFLRQARQACGPVFTLNLAGLRTTVVSEREAMRAVAMVTLTH